MQEKLKELALRYEDLQAKLADPSVYGDAERLKTVNRELKDLTPVAEAYQAYRQAEADRAAAEELLSSLSDRWPHRDALQAGLLRRTGRGEEAAELWERRLLNAATEVYESLVSLQELALQAERLEDGARLAALIEETAERYALIPGVASSGRLQQAAAEGDKTAALSALRDMLEALNRSWDGGGLYPHLLPGTQVAVGSGLLPGLLLELQREPELAFLQDEPDFLALLKRYGGGTH